MNARARLDATRRMVMAAMVAHALLAGLAVATILGAALMLAARAGRPTPPAGWPIAVVAGAAVALLLASARVQRARPMDVALLVERLTPGLRYALVTLADEWRGALALEPATRAGLERAVTAARWEPAAWRAAWRPLRSTAVIALLGVALAAAARTVPARGARGVTPGRDGAAATATGVGGRPVPGLAVQVRVAPPGYSGLAARTLDEPATVAALVGSTLELRGDAPAAAVRVSVGERALPVTAQRGGWRAVLAMPAAPAAIRLTRGATQRLVVLEPRPDSAPDVALRLPARDTVLRAPEGTVALAADARDDLGLASGAVEYIVSSGEGESFRFRSGTLGARRFGGAGRGALEARLDLAALALEPGDIVHLRAVARDANPAGALGASATRTLRVARRGEYDSVSVEAAPPPEADKSVLSQRMLLRLAEALVARERRLARATLVDESRRIATDQKRLRRTVGDMVFSRLGGEGSAEHAHGPGDAHVEGDEGAARGARTPEQVLKAADAATGSGIEGALDFEGDETPVVAINRPLLEAYNAMWEAAQALDVGAPREALPPMRRALAAIQRARQAERVYLRGRPPAVVVDVAKVRLAGADRPTALAERGARPSVEDAARRRADRVARAIALAGRDAGAAADSLLLLRVYALADDPALARALGEAVDALRAGRDATAALVRARRAAAGDAVPGTADALWSGAWPGAGVGATEARRP